MIPITIITGFLGAGKTTLVNKIIAQHPQIRFGLIINEFGAEGIDGQLIESGEEEIVELSNGCICCVVRKDLEDAAQQLIDSGNVDYIIVETSGLAEPAPVAQTFAINDFNGKAAMDAVICVVDASNYITGLQQYQVGAVQLETADIVIINKQDQATPADLEKLDHIISRINPGAARINNVNNNIDTLSLIETNKWNVESMHQAQGGHTHEHDEHVEHDHEHHHVDEVVFTTRQPISSTKINEWISTKFPANAVRAKGILRLELFPGQYGTFLFQMVGATRMLVPFLPQRPGFDREKSTLVVIGKDLDETEILADLKQTVA